MGSTHGLIDQGRQIQEGPHSTSVGSSVPLGTTPGLALVPPKVVQKILRGEYIEMHELLPETWRM